MSICSLLFSTLDLTGAIIRISSLIFFIAVAKTSLKLRSKHSNSPCNDCQEGSFPYCSYKLDDMKQIILKGDLEELPRDFLTSTIAKLESQTN